MEWFLANSEQVFSLAGQHLVLAILPMVFGVLIAVPLAQVARQNRGLRSVVLTGVLAALHHPVPGAVHHPADRPREPGSWTPSTWSWP